MEISDIVVTFAPENHTICYGSKHFNTFILAPMLMPRPLPIWKWMLMLMTAFAILNVAYFQKDRLWMCGSIIVILAGAVIITASVIVLYHLWRRFVERRNANDLLRRSMFPPLLKGCLLGVVLYVLCIAISVAFGIYTVELTGASFLGPLRALVFCFMVGVSEEIIFRGIVFRYIDKRFNFWAALIISALFFGIAHCPRPWISISEIALGMGLLEAVLYKYSRTLWLPIGVHFAWDSMCGFFDKGRLSFYLDYEPPLEAIPCETGFAVGDWQGIEGATISIILHLLVTAWIIRRIKDI